MDMVKGDSDLIPYNLFLDSLTRTMSENHFEVLFVDCLENPHTVVSFAEKAVIL